MRDALNLPALTKDTAKCWWRVGKQALLDVLPHPEKISVLRKLAHTKESESQKRALILDLVGRAIHSLAPKAVQ